ncbi:hypothetical protein JCM8097_007892 [Rhodosporidiobolus ruineniae]
MLASAGQLAFLATFLLGFAAAAPTTTTFQPSRPAATPQPAPPTRRILPLSALDHVFGNSTSSSSSSNVVARGMMEGEFELAERGLFERSEKEDSKVLKKRRLQIRATCVDSTANDAYITSLFYYGGAGTVVYLCPGAVIKTTNAIFFSAANQILTTYGNPTDSTRALIQVTGGSQSCAVYGAWDGANNAILRNVQVDGARPTLGMISGGNALLEFGGNTVGQQVINVKAWEPRGWSVLHTAEGSGNSCSGMQVYNNDIGPSGHAPSGATQFRKRDNTGTYTPGQWADGISHACKASRVTNNIITDATDGGIVIFGAPGSYVQGNSIFSVNRQLMGGINAVDWAPFAGSYEGTVVTGNNIVSTSSMIKVGIAIGGMVWGTDNRTAARTYAGTFTNNNLMSGTAGYFGFGIAVSGHNAATVQGNRFQKANFGGVDSAACFTAYYPLPPPEALVADPYTTTGSVFQAGFDLKQTIVLAICRGPGAIIWRNINAVSKKQ